jgi:hypothetical protein
MNAQYSTQQGLADTIRNAIATPAYPQYAYGIVQAVALASELGIKNLSVLELGVAGGNGLVALQRYSMTHSEAAGVDIHVVGFDLGKGMPPPVDYRDMPYIWHEGSFKMNEDELRDRLSTAALHLGDIATTGEEFINSYPAPIGFVSFDLDYYSSTVRAFDALLCAAETHYLPRVICYFDDTVGPHHEMHSCFTGELLAIDEFNYRMNRRKLAKINGIQRKLGPMAGWWTEGLYVLHLFDHPLYNNYIFHQKDRQSPLLPQRTIPKYAGK